MLNVVKTSSGGSGQLSLDASGNLFVNIASITSLSALASNIAQFGGANVSTGTGASGAGIPRVTVSNDSNILATQSGTWSVRTQDGSGNNLTSTGSALDVNLKTSSITLPVSLTSTTITGTVAVTQNTSPWVVSLTSTTITGTVAVTQNTSPWVTNNTQWNSVALGSPSTFGASPGAVAVIGTNASVYAGTTGLVADGAGNLKVNLSAVSVGTLTTQDAADASAGSALPSVATAVGGANGNLFRFLSVDPLGNRVVAENGGQSDILTQLLRETRAMRSAIVALVTENGKTKPSDFEPNAYQDIYISEIAQ